MEVKPFKIEIKDTKKEMFAITFTSTASTVGLCPSKVEFYYAAKNKCISKLIQNTRINPNNLLK